MTIPYITFMKHGEKVTKTAPSGRPVLQGVYHADNGDLVVTDSHRLYVAKDAQTRNDGASINPKTGISIEGNYPGISQLIPNNDPKFTVQINVIEALKAFKALKGCSQVKDKLGSMKITVADDRKTHVHVESNIMEAKYFIGYADEMADEQAVTFNGQFVIDALEMFKDAGVIEVMFNSYGAMRPFTLKQNDNLLALILPIRER